MACVSCEGYEKRITNVYRDEELKEKFEKLIGYQILIDCFICDGCNARLQDYIEFQDNCIRVYKKNNSNFHQFEKPNLQQERKVDVEDEYLILQTNDDVFMNDEQPENQSINDQYTVYELNEPTKKIQIEAPVQKKSPRKAAKLKRESVQECLIIEKQSENEDSLMINEELLISDENLAYEVEGTDNSQGAKRVRKSYSVQQKLEIIDYAEKYSNREAARNFELNESTVRCFKRQKDTLMEMNPAKSTKRHGTPYWPDLETKLKDWVEKQAVKPRMMDVKEEAINIAKSMGYQDFSGSNTYIFKFMQRNNIEAASPRPRKKVKIEDTSDV